jgi:hypothetical protein
MGRYARSVWHACVGRQSENPVVVETSQPAGETAAPGEVDVQVLDAWRSEQPTNPRTMPLSMMSVKSVVDKSAITYEHLPTFLSAPDCRIR